MTGVHLSEPLQGMLSHYRIVGHLGAGGMGTVYRAHDERLGRDLALKVLLAESMADPTARARLIQEARMASSLNHPHIAQVYDVGEARYHVFIAMELVEGRQLHEWIPPGGLSAASLLRFGAQIADALAYAHEHGVIHRDLKSANIMVTPEGRAKVLDFGLAKRFPGGADSTGTPDPHLTTSGTMLGTPSHLPPEVLLGGKADARSDVWALGVVLYEMASGKLPFTGGSLPAIAGAILHEPPIPLSDHVSAGIQAVIVRCLSKDPSQRYHNAGEVRAAIETLIGAGTPRSAGSATRRLGVAAAGLGILALGLVIAFNGELRDRVLGRGSGPRIRSLAVLPLANLSGDPAQEYFADGMTEELITVLAPTQSLKVISRTSIMRFKNTKEALRAIAHTLGVDAIVQGSVQRAGDRVRITAQLIEAATEQHLWVRTYERAFVDVLTLQSEVARDIAGEIRLKVSADAKARLKRASPVNPQAYELYMRGRFQWNRRNADGMRRAIAYFSEAIRNDSLYAPAHSGLADAWAASGIGGFVPPTTAYPQAKQAALRAVQLDPGLSEAYVSLGNIRQNFDWEWDAAARDYRRAIELNGNNAVAHHWYANHLALRGEFDRSMVEIRTAQDLDPLSLPINVGAGAFLYYARRYDEALQECSRALQGDSASAVVNRTMAASLLQLGREGEAAVAIQRWLEGSYPRGLVDRAVGEHRRSGLPGLFRVLVGALEAVRSTGVYGPATQLAELYSVLGEREKALHWLKVALSEHDPQLNRLKVDPVFDPLRGDPRFEELVRATGLGPPA